MATLRSQPWRTTCVAVIRNPMNHARAMTARAQASNVQPNHAGDPDGGMSGSSDPPTPTATNTTPSTV